MIKATMVAHSKNEFGNEIASMEVVMPRFILAEFNTHRMFSRNSASSRAIPFEKMLKMVEETPFIPMAWQREHKGMQGTDYITDPKHIDTCVKDWLFMRDTVINSVKTLSSGFEVDGEMVDKVTKQLCNRPLEAFMYHKVLVTATEWENFFALRCPRYYPEAINFTGKSYRSKKDFKANENCKEITGLESWEELPDFHWLNINKGMAEIHMMAVAEAMWDCLNESTPRQLKAGEWHIPYGDSISYKELNELTVYLGHKDLTLSRQADLHEEFKLKIATANAAGISYTVIGEDGKQVPYDKLIVRTDKLAKDGHWSCFEHCAQAMDNRRAGFVGGIEQGASAWSGNFKGFIQYRKTFDNENIAN